MQENERNAFADASTIDMGPDARACFEPEMFAGFVIDATRWSIADGNPSIAMSQAGGLNFQFSMPGNTVGRDGITTTGTFDLTSATVDAHVAQASGDGTLIQLDLLTDARVLVAVSIRDGMTLELVSSNTMKFTAFSNPYIRLSHAASEVAVSTSPDGSTYQLVLSIPEAIDLSDVRVDLNAQIYKSPLMAASMGSWGSVRTTTPACPP